MLCSVLTSVALLTAAGLPSGPGVGDKLPELKAHAVLGPDEGKEIDVRKVLKEGPTLLIFVHKITRPALQCLRPIDDYAAKNDALAAHIVWLGDKEKTVEYIKRAKNSLNLQIPMSVAFDKDGPPSYGLNDMVTLTILVANQGKVVANFALTDPNANDSPKVIDVLKKLSEKKK